MSDTTPSQQRRCVLLLLGLFLATMTVSGQTKIPAVVEDSFLYILDEIDETSSDDEAGNMQPCPADPSLVGYLDTPTFLADLIDQQVETFLLCPSVIYTLDTPMMFDSNHSASIRCADENGGCVVESLFGHLMLRPAAGQSILMHSITLRGTTESQSSSSPSVIIEAETTATKARITFVNCVWENHVGVAAIHIDAVEEATTRKLQPSEPVSGELQDGLVDEVDGPIVTILNTTFADNNVFTNSTIHVQAPVNLIVSGCEFSPHGTPILNLQANTGGGGTLSFLGHTTFRDANNTTPILLTLDPTHLTQVHIVRCRFLNNTGPASIEVQGVVSDATTSQIVSVLSVAESWFQYNDQSTAVINSEAGILVVTDGYFANNIVGESLIRIAGGAIGTVRSIAFHSNGVDRGLVFVDVGAELLDSTDLCGGKNTPGNFACNGTFLQVSDAAACNDGDQLACATSCEDVEACSTDPIDDDDDYSGCHSDWANLTGAIASGGDFLLCPGTPLVLSESDTPIEIGEFQTSIKCPQDKECIIQGGLRHFLIPDGDANVIFEGITFRGAEMTSIEISVDPSFPAEIEFYRCVWENNTGTSVLNMYEPGTSGRRLGDVSLLLAEVRISECQFLSNTNTDTLVQNSAMVLVVEYSMFRSNEARSMIETDGGQTLLVKTRFGYNTIEDGVVYVGPDVLGYNETDVCGINNTVGTGNNCNGTFFSCSGQTDCEERCESFVVCPPMQADCYDDYSELAAAIMIFEGSTFEICEESTLVVSDPSAIAVIDYPGTVIRCGTFGSRSDSCTITGGAKHFRIEGNFSGVELHGITFQYASLTSITIELDSELSLQEGVTFYDCHWQWNNGTETFLITAGEMDVPVQESPPSRMLQPNASSSNMVTISSCLFESNTASDCILSNNAASLALDYTTFYANVANESVLELASGASSTVEEVRFEGNTVRRGMVFVDSNASFVIVGDASETCSKNDTSTGLACTGVLEQSTEADGCLDGVLDDCDAMCEELPPCTETSDECYNVWEKLSASVSAVGGDETFVICPGSIFNLTESDATSPLQITDSNVELRCGAPDAVVTESCQIIGGDDQVIIMGSVVDVRLVGLTFIGANQHSIIAAADQDSTASITDCTFMLHRGLFAVVINSNYSSPTTRSLGAMPLDLEDSRFRELQVVRIPPAASTRAMSLDISSSLFRGNRVQFAPIGNIAGNMTVTHTRFEQNTGEAGAIIGDSEAGVTVSDSCFVGNTGNLSGAIVIQERSVLLGDSNNFGDSNTALAGNCTHILLVDEMFGCGNFNASSCSAVVSLPPVSSLPISPPIEGGPCLSDWVELHTAVTASMGSETFLICSDTTFELDDYEDAGLVPLQVNASSITIACSSQRQHSCIIRGGSVHFRMLEAVQQVTFRALTLEGASESSVHIVSQPPFSVRFDNCVWRLNAGNVTVLVNNTQVSTSPTLAPTTNLFGFGGNLGNNDDGVNNRFLEDTGGEDSPEPSVVFICDGCLFENNTAGEALLSFDRVTAILEEMEFDDNAVMGSVISTSGSSISISSSCFSNNEFQDSLVQEDSSSIILLEDTFGAANANTPGCDGVVVDGACQAFDSSVCIARNNRCFAHWDDLRTAVEGVPDGQDGGVFTICDNTVLDLSGLPTLQISRSRTTIRCGVSGSLAGNCVISGGEVQVEISETPTDVSFMGLSFTGASVAAINAAGGRSASANVHDCSFASMQSGQAAILIYDGPLPTNRRLQSAMHRRAAISDFAAPANDRSMSLGIQFSKFQDNQVELAPVANLGGSIVLNNCTFDGNSGGESGAIGVWFRGGVDVSDSCFTMNSGSLAGAVYVSDTSSFPPEQNVNNFVASNSVQNGQCLTIFVEGGCESENVCNGLCLEGDASECLVNEAPTMAPTPAPTWPNQGEMPSQSLDGCLETWSELKQAVVDADYSLGTEVVFVICPGTALAVGDDGPLEINQGDVLLQCGARGDLLDDCVIIGGQVQILLTGAPTGVSLSGLTMMDSSVVSVQATAASTVRAEFNRCRWKGHRGSAVALIYSEESTIDAQTDFSQLDPPTSQLMTVSWESCQFVENNVTFATVANFGGTSTFSATLFRENIKANTGVVFGSFGAFVGLTTSCFEENESNYPGALFLTNQAQLSTNMNNYGEDNIVLGGSGEDACVNGVFLETSGSCLEDGFCSGTCSVLEAEECAIADTVPSATPSGMPSVLEDSFNTTLIGFHEQSLFSSGYWLRNILLAVLIVVVGVGGYFFCRSRQQKATGGGSSKAPSTTNTRSADHQDTDEHKSEEDDDDYYDDDDDDDDENNEYTQPPATVADKEQKPDNKKKGLSIFGLGNGKKGNKRNKRTDIAEPYFADDDVIFDPDVSLRRKKQRKSSGGLFGFNKKKKKDNNNDKNMSAIAEDSDDHDDLDDEDGIMMGMSETILDTKPTP